MEREQIIKQDGMEGLLMHNPLRCKVINEKIELYKEEYGKDVWLEGYQHRYNDFIQLERNEPIF